MHVNVSLGLIHMEGDENGEQPERKVKGSCHIAPLYPLLIMRPNEIVHDSDKAYRENIGFDFTL